MTASFAELDALLVKAARRVRILGSLSYPDAAAQRFLESYRQGQPVAPERPLVKTPPASVVEALTKVCDEADQADPRGRFLHRTADAYLEAAAMLAAAGTPAFHRHCQQLYGDVGDRLPGSELTHLEAAERLLDSTAALREATLEHDVDYCLTADHVADEMRRRLAAFFADDTVKVVIDPDLASKAAASGKRVRLRAGTCFSSNDVEQLVQHEAFVHSATSLNGRKQPTLTALSLGAPRTTATQEGLATFAELVTGAMDLARLRRIALRVRAVHLAEEGAGFVDVFKCFLDAGQSELESTNSTLRVYRGADPDSRHPFTKDVVYLRGIFAVHTFFRRAIVDVRPELIERLFVGRLTLGDVLDLEEEFEAGAIAPPRYVPAWARDVRSLAAFLSFSAVVDAIDLGDLSLTDVASV